METDDPQMIGPDGLWAAKDVPKIYIEAAWHSKQDLAEVFWSVPGKAGFSQERKVSFTVKPDGRFHLYEVDLASSPAYKGPITSLRFDPVPAGGPEEYIDVRSISWKVD